MRKQKKLLGIVLLCLLMLEGCSKTEAELIVIGSTTQITEEVFGDNGGSDLKAEQSIAVNKRLRTEFISEFEPSEEYGRVYPFVQNLELEGEAFDSHRNNGMNVVCSYGFCDENGRIVCDGIYDEITYWENGEDGFYLCVKDIKKEEMVESEFFVVSLAGDYIKAYEDVIILQEWRLDEDIFYGRYSDYHLECIPVKQDNKWGTIDYTGKPDIAAIYDEPVIFTEGVAPVRLSADSYGYINRNEEVVLGPFEYPFTPEREFSFIYRYLYAEERAAFYNGDKWGYLDNNGEVIIPAIYDLVDSFENGGYASVLKDNQPRYIDRWGNQVSLAGFDDIEYRGGGWFLVSVDNEFCYWNQKHLLPLNGQVSETGWLVNHQDGQLCFSQGEESVLIGIFSEAIELSNGNFLCIDAMAQEWIIVSSDGEILLSRQKGTACEIGGRVVAETNYGYAVYSLNGRGVADNALPKYFDKEIEFRIEQLPNNYYCVYDSNEGGVLNQNGEWLIRCFY